MTSTEIIKVVLKSNPTAWQAVHEITAKARRLGYYISDNAAASRLCMDLKGEVDGRFRRGTRFKEWRIKEWRTCSDQGIQPENAREAAQEIEDLDFFMRGENELYA